jgi:hypothetical protein
MSLFDQMNQTWRRTAKRERAVFHVRADLKAGIFMVKRRSEQEMMT